MAKSIIILGTGGNCVDILDAILEINDHASQAVYDCIGFLDDRSELWGSKIQGVAVLGGLNTAGQYPESFFVNGIGSTRTFWKKLDIIAGTGVAVERFETVIHPTASVSRMARLGHGVVILQQVTVASNARLGNHVMVLPNSIISHDDRVGDGAIIAGSVCVNGGVEIGPCCYIGSNSSIREYCKIGARSLIGMGSVVLKDVAEGSVMVGNPARRLEERG
jgi:sugar O-acyltransferase (sialic acid O-acetyltransferase NeuD family)